MKKNDKRLKPIFYDKIPVDYNQVNEIYYRYTYNSEFMNIYK